MRSVNLRYSRRARRQLNNIHSYIQERDPAAATRVIARIRRSVDLLLDFPKLGPHGVVTGTREVVVVGLPYVVVFSNRPFRVKHFQTFHRCSVDVSHGLALLFGIGTEALPSWS